MLTSTDKLIIIKLKSVTIIYVTIYIYILVFSAWGFQYRDRYKMTLSAGKISSEQQVQLHTITAFSDNSTDSDV